VIAYLVVISKYVLTILIILENAYEATS